MSWTTSGTSRVACGLHGYRSFLPFSVWVSCLIVGQEEVILGPSSVSERGKDTAGKKGPSPAEGGNIRDDFSLFHSWFPWSPRNIFEGVHRELRKCCLGLVLCC